MKRITLTLTQRVAVLVILVAALGGLARLVIGHPPAHHAPAVARCTPANSAAQCNLPPAPRALLLPHATVGAVHGIDFAWSCPSPSGQAFGASYFSPDSTKNWSRGCVNAYHAAGAKTVGVWESSADRATQGFNAGYTDAAWARTQARNVGEPDNRPIDYAVDCDCAVSSITSYFSGVVAGTANTLHISHAAAVQLVGVYGGYYQVRGLFNAGLVGHTNWQTYAWSGGLWLPASIAPLEQYLNGNAVDWDRAIAPDYGQWPYNVVPPPPPVDPFRFLNKHPQPQPGVSKASEYATVLGWDKHHCKNTDRHGTCGRLRKHMVLLRALIWRAALSEPSGPVGFGHSGPSWNFYHRGFRFAVLTHRVH